LAGMKPTCTTQQVWDTTSNWNFQSIHIVGFLLFFKFLWLCRYNFCSTCPPYTVHLLGFRTVVQSEYYACHQAVSHRNT
jgi:hypothetical protein